jgi:hypothetical protein
MSLLPCNFFFSNFLDFEILYDLDFDQIHLVNVYFHRKRHVFIIQSIVCLGVFFFNYFFYKL